MNLTASSDWWRGEINWDTPAGRALRKFFAALPADRQFRLTLYGSAPLQLTPDPHWLSADVDLFSNDDEDLAQWVDIAGLNREAGEFYLEPGFELSFRTSPRWRDRARVYPLGHVTLTLPHPLDILIGKLDRLESKDLLAFRRVIEIAGHPTEAELRHELQNAVDLFRPSFDDESPNRYPDNACRLWVELFGRKLDLRRDIIKPALARRAVGYGESPPGYKRALGE